MVSLVIKHQHCYYYFSRSLHTVKQEIKTWDWMKTTYPDIRDFNEKITRGFQKQLLPLSTRLERTKSVCSWSAAMFHCRECGHPKHSHILSKLKICSKVLFRFHLQYLLVNVSPALRWSVWRVQYSFQIMKI